MANEVHGIVEGAMTEDHFLDLIDWAKAHRLVLSFVKDICQ